MKNANDVRSNLRFIKTDDEEEACRLLFNAYYEIVFDEVDRRGWNHPNTVVDPDHITSETFIIAFTRAREVAGVVVNGREKPDD